PPQGYTLRDLPRQPPHFVHCYPDNGVIGQTFQADFGLVCDPILLVNALPPDSDAGAHRDAQWLSRLADNIRQHVAWPDRRPERGVPFENVVRSVSDRAPDHTVICLDAGTFAAPVYRHFRFRPPQRLLSPLAGAMGYGTPAAIANALRRPDTKTICMVGDGGFMMTGNEMILAAQRRLPVLFILSNNDAYASIRINQEREYPGRVSGTSLFNPDFVQIAQAFGMPSFRIEDAAQVDSTVERAMAMEIGRAHV